MDEYCFRDQVRKKLSNHHYGVILVTPKLTRSYATGQGKSERIRLHAEARRRR